MKPRPTLYELLGVPHDAAVAEIQAGYRREMSALEDRRAAVPPQEFNERVQLLRVAYSTLTDAAARTGYDAKLEAAARATPAAAVSRALALGAADADPHASGAAAGTRADSMSLRADALALRADAMLMRAGLDAPLARDVAGTVWSGTQKVVRAIGMLVVIGMVTFGLTRCAGGGNGQQRMEAQSRAAEQIALQEYYQTYGVRPANMAELQLMEAARRRKENEQRQAEQDRRAQQEQERRFEEESRRIGREATADLQRSEQQARWRAEREAERERQLKFRAEQLKLEAELAKTDAERRRLELQRKQTLEQLKQQPDS